MKRNTTILAICGLVALVGLWLLARQTRQASDFNNGSATNAVANPFATATSGLPHAKTSEMVQLKNGDTFNLTASLVQKDIHGKSIKMLAYNGMIPGPLIKVPQNSQITVHFTNNTDVPTTIHSHGVRLDNAFDGVPDSTQPVIPVGGSFDYTLKFPDAGLFWYHPHVREDYAQALGLYGNFLVEPTDVAYWSPVNQEVLLMLSDILLNTDGSIVPYDQNNSDHTLMGRYGNVLLANGQTNYQLQAKTGEVIRFYLTNAANARPLNIAIPNAKLKLVGGDNGKYERETFVDSVILGPSERAAIEVLFDKSGQYILQNKTPDKTYSLGTISVTSQVGTPSFVSQFNTLRTNQDVIKGIDPFRSSFAKAVDKNLTLTVNWSDMGNMNMGGSNGSTGMHMMGNGMMMSNGAMGSHMMPDGSMMGGGGPIEWEDTMMGMASDKNTVQWKIVDQDTGKATEDISWNFKVGDKIKVKIFNDPNSAHPMQHPIHFHGQRFLVLSTNGVRNDNLVWKDTVLIGSGETVELLIDMSNPGTWMAHCHIAEHLEDGMMFSYKVNPL